MLDFRIYTFLEVCKTKNYTRAAENLNITQPAVTQHIRYLEGYYGHPLIEIKNRRVYLTTYGQELCSVLQTMVHDEAHMIQVLDQMEEKKKVLKLGTTMTIGECVIADRIADYTKRHPDTSISMHVANTEELLRHMTENTIDFAIIEGYFSKSEYEYRRYSLENFIAVCGADYVIEDEAVVEEGKKQNKNQVTIEQLFKYPLISRELGSGTREILEKALGERNYSVQDFVDATEINSIHVIKTLLKRNCGISFLYEAAVQEEIAEGTLRQIPVADFSVSHDFNFIWRKGSVFRAYYEEMFQELRGDISCHYEKNV